MSRPKSAEKKKTKFGQVATEWPAYNPQSIAPKWQQRWEAEGLYLTQESGEKLKYYCMDFFPYPSGEGLYVGHCRNYIPTDIISRYMRMQGYNVLHPMGWDAFGEPAEQQAFVQTKVQQHLVEQELAKIFYVLDRIFNIVTRK